jgi:hypothetical protein
MKKHCTISSMATFARPRPAWQGWREHAMIRLESFHGAAADSRRRCARSGGADEGQIDQSRALASNRARLMVELEGRVPELF